MKPPRIDPDIYQLRIVLRDISPLIWRRLLVRSDTTLAQLHRMLQTSFEWSNEHLYRFHIFGKDFGYDAADTQQVVYPVSTDNSSVSQSGKIVSFHHQERGRRHGTAHPVLPTPTGGLGVALYPGPCLVA
jgi:hypothetical protein